MYKFTLLLLLIFFVSGCTSSPSNSEGEVFWHGTSPSRTYTFTFVDSSNSPVKGVTFQCFGEVDSIAMYVSSDLNNSASASDELGYLQISHGGYQTHGSYKKKGNEISDLQIPDLPNCEFYYKDRIILTGNLSSFKGKQTVLVSEKTT